MSWATFWAALGGQSAIFSQNDQVTLIGGKTKEKNKRFPNRLHTNLLTSSLACPACRHGRVIGRRQACERCR
jgi:hypothetical protein